MVAIPITSTELLNAQVAQAVENLQADAELLAEIYSIETFRLWRARRFDHINRTDDVAIDWDGNEMTFWEMVSAYLSHYDHVPSLLRALRQGRPMAKRQGWWVNVG